VSPALIVLGLVGIGVGLSMRGADHEQEGYGGGYGPPPVPPVDPTAPPVAVPGMFQGSCDQALDALAATNPQAATMATAIRGALAGGTDAAALDKLATGIEQGASSPSLTPPQRAAALKVAQCCRDRASVIRATANPTATPGAVAPSCEAALTTLGAMNPEAAAMAGSVRAALALSSDADALDALGNNIDKGAGAPGLTAAQVTAAHTVAACLHARATEIRKIKASSTGGLTLPPLPSLGGMY